MRDPISHKVSVTWMIVLTCLSRFTYDSLLVHVQAAAASIFIREEGARNITDGDVIKKDLRSHVV